MSLGQNMPYKVELAKSAEEDLDKALNRLAVEFNSPNSAARLLAEFRCLEPILSSYPKFKPIDYPASEYAKREVRRAQVRNYLAYYVIDDANEVVTIISFLAMKQDQMAHLIKDLQGQN